MLNDVVEESQQDLTDYIHSVHPVPTAVIRREESFDRENYRQSISAAERMHEQEKLV
jgi:hypothetical protein